MLRLSFRPAARGLAIAGLFLTGVLSGVWLQHRWPVGRWRQPDQAELLPAPEALSRLHRLPADRRVVILAAGQSNAANYVETRASGGAGVYVFHDGKLFVAADPLPGGDGSGGSIWSRLGAKLISSGDVDAVVFAVAAQGSTRVSDWAPGGPLSGRLGMLLADLCNAGLPPDFVLWQQGESEAIVPASSGQDYETRLRAIVMQCRDASPSTVFIAAISGRHGDLPVNEQIRLAQSATQAWTGAQAGPDFDELKADLRRRDGVHFSARGASVAADLWLTTLRPLLAERAARLRNQ